MRKKVINNFVFISVHLSVESSPSHAVVWGAWK